MSADNQAYKDLIYLHLDGQATEAESQALFRAMAEDSELRAEFDEAVKLDKALMLDKTELTLPPSLTNKVFEAAGFATESAMQAPPPVGVVGNGVFGKLINSVATAIVLSSVAFTGLTMFNSMNQSVNTKDNKANIARSINTQIAKQYDIKASPNSTTPMASTSLSSKQIAKANTANDDASLARYRRDNSSNKNTKKDNQLANDIVYLATDEDVANAQNINYTNNANDAKLNDELAQNTGQIISKERNEVASYTDFYALASSEIRGQYTDNFNIIIGANGNEYLPIEMNYPSNSNFSLAVNGLFNTNYFPNREILQSNDPLQNLNLSLNYHYSDNHTFGLELGAEDLQVYEITQIGAKFKFDLKPTLYWLGLSYRFTFDELIDALPLRAYSQVSLGGSKYGPVTKLGAGLSYELNSKLAISIGYDWTSLMYTHMSSYRFTHKTGLKYSISYKL